MTKKVKYIFNLDKPITNTYKSNIKIKNVVTKKDFIEFFRLPWKIYKNDENWVPPLWDEINGFFKIKNPFWKHAESCLFIAYKNNEIVGRIAAVIDNLFIKKEKENIGYFGFFEVDNDYEIAKYLIGEAERWLKNKKMEKMRGPIDGRIDVGCGLLLNSYDQTPFIFSSYNPKYYVDFVEKYGMKKCRDLLNYYLNCDLEIPKKLKNAAEKIEKKGIKIRGFNRFRAKKELKWWIPLMMEIFSSHWGYIDASEEEVRNRFGIKQIRWIADPKFLLVAESPNGDPIGFKWVTPDYNQVIKKLNGKLGVIGYLKFFYYSKKVSRARFNFVGVKKEWQGKGIGSAFNYWTMLELKKRNYSGAEIGWIDEKNVAEQKSTEKTGAKLYKKYRVYEKKL